MNTAASNPRTPLSPTHDAARLTELRQKSGWQLTRATLEANREMLARWIDADVYHAGQNAEDWLRERPGVENMLVLDRKGPLFFLRCSNVMRTDIQFAPGESRELRVRIGMALKSGLPWLANESRKRGFREMIFESSSPKLVQFLETMGFRSSETEYVLTL